MSGLACSVLPASGVGEPLSLLSEPKALLSSSQPARRDTVAEHTPTLGPLLYSINAHSRSINARSHGINAHPQRPGSTVARRRSRVSTTSGPTRRRRACAIAASTRPGRSSARSSLGFCCSSASPHGVMLALALALAAAGSAFCASAGHRLTGSGRLGRSGGRGPGHWAPILCSGVLERAAASKSADPTAFEHAGLAASVLICLKARREAELHGRVEFAGLPLPDAGGAPPSDRTGPHA